MKREIPILITLVAGMFMLIAWFVPHPMVRGAYEGNAAGGTLQWLELVE